MFAREYFRLVDAITAAHTDAQLSALGTWVAALALHPFERRALERQLRARERALQIEIEGL